MNRKELIAECRRIKELPEEEIRKISRQKNSVGCATEVALFAQKLLCERAGNCFCRVHNPGNIHRDNGSIGQLRGKVL